jgi:hypothetical protein
LVERSYACGLGCDASARPHRGTRRHRGGGGLSRLGRRRLDHGPSPWGRRRARNRKCSAAPGRSSCPIVESKGFEFCAIRPAAPHREHL